MKMNLSLFDFYKIYITGIEVAYYIICKRKLWLFSKQISFEHTSEFIEIGKIIEKQFYRKEEKITSYLYEPIKIDFITLEDGIVIHEVKKGKSLETAHIYQVKYYIWFLRNRGINVKYGIIHYPKLLRKIEVYLESTDDEKIKNALNEILKIKFLKKPPEVINKPYCRKCSYFYFCYG
jgi:CRISPR-associated exonuclease Cas4